MMDDVEALLDVAAEAAKEAGRYIASVRPTLVEHKANNQTLAAQVVTDVDRKAEAIVLEKLRPTLDRHALALLTEEQEDDGGRLRSSRFWCIDPLDGTLPYIEGHPGYAIAIGLVSSSGEALGGIVYAPARDVLYRAAKGKGATKNGTSFSGGGASPKTLVAFVDRSFSTLPQRTTVEAILSSVAASLGVALEFKVGAGGVLNGCGVVEHVHACYLKLPKMTPGGGSLWDFAATACIVDEAGGMASDVAGRPLDLNRADSTFMNHRGILYSSSPRVHQLVVDAIDAIDVVDVIDAEE